MTYETVPTSDFRSVVPAHAGVFVGLPRADEPGAPAPDRRVRRNVATSIRLGPVGISVVVHAVVFAGFALLGVAARTPEGLGEARTLALSSSADPESDDAISLLPPEELPEVEVLEVVPPEPRLPEPVPLEEEAVDLEDMLLEPLDLALYPAEVARGPRLPLSVAVRPRPTAPPTVVATPAPSPPTLRVAPRPARPPRATTPPRPRARAAGGATAGRLRPLRTPIHYPPEARRRGLEGRARVEMLITADGGVSSVRLVTSTGYPTLDQAALASAREWRFAPPGTHRRIVQPFRFRLR